MSVCDQIVGCRGSVVDRRVAAPASPAQACGSSWRPCPARWPRRPAAFGGAPALPTPRPAIACKAGGVGCCGGSSRLCKGQTCTESCFGGWRGVSAVCGHCAGRCPRLGLPLLGRASPCCVTCSIDRCPTDACRLRASQAAWAQGRARPRTHDLSARPHLDSVPHLRRAHSPARPGINRREEDHTLWRGARRLSGLIAGLEHRPSLFDRPCGRRRHRYHEQRCQVGNENLVSPCLNPLHAVSTRDGLRSSNVGSSGATMVPAPVVGNAR